MSDDDAARNRAQEELEMLLAQVPVGIFRTDVNGECLFVNEQWCRLAGLSPEEAIGHGWRRALHPDDREKVAVAWYEAARRRDDFHLEYRFQRPDGHVTWVAGSARPLVDAAGEHIGYLGSLNDVTARRQAEAALRDSERQLQLVTDHAPVMIAHCNADLRFKFVNKAYAERFGLTPRDFVGRGISEVLGEEAFASFKSYVADVLAGNPVVFEAEVPYKTGGTQYVRGAYTPERDASGAVVGWVAAVINITERRRAEEEREHALAVAQRARGDAEIANRAKDEFLAVLSHELRSPLNAMLGWVRILQRAGGNEELIARAVETLERNVWAQSQVIDELLDISRITSGKLRLERTRVDLSETVAGVVESMRPMATGKGLTLTLDTTPGRIEVEGDAARLQQIVGNMLHNALKFTPESGRVSVRLGTDGDRAVVEVEDDGQGIEADLLPRVFERFVQSEASTVRRHGGLGLGLAIVKELALLHGGTVAASSAGPARGAAFSVRLPLAPPAPAGATRIQPSGTARDEISSLDVLVVEDDADSREALGILLEQSGARVRLADSVRQALDQYEIRPPDLLVSDLGMPGEDGYALIRAIREREEGRLRRTLAIAITGFASRLDYETALRAGFDEHVAKPVEPEALLERIRVLAASRALP